MKHAITLLIFCNILIGQPWSGVIDSTRAIDWSNAGVVGGIPSYPACTTGQAGTTIPISAYSGSAAAINTALANCATANPTGSYLLLAPGTFNLSTGIDLTGHNHVVLRGAGANLTFLIFTGNAFCGGYDAMVCVSPPTSAPGGSEGNVCNWTAGYSVGATTITLTNCGSTTPALGSLSNLKIGSIVTLDQVDLAGDPGTIWSCTNGVLSSVMSNHCAQEGNGGVGRADGPSVGGIIDRTQQQVVRVTNCINIGGVCTSGINITISPGLYMPNWTGTQLPQAWYGTTFSIGNGLENVSVSYNNVFVSNFNVTMGSCYGCWVKGIRSLYGSRAHFMMAWSSHLTLQDSYAALSLTGGSQSYGVETHFPCDSLVQNNIFQQVTAASPDTTAEGMVVAYNVGIDTVYTAGPGFAEASFDFHSGGDSYNLLEGNIGFSINSDDIHGTHHFESFFRNYITGWQPSCAGVPCTQQTNPFILMAGSRYFNIIGNILGTPSYHTQYQSAALSTAVGTSVPVSIYQLGYTGVNGNVDTAANGYCTTPTCSANSYYDAQTTNYLMRWGNWDAVNASIQFNNSEVPSTVSPYGNAIPSSHTLPTSFWLSSKPSWWGSGVWPPIGPDVTGGNIGICSGGTYNMVPALTNGQCTGGSLITGLGGHANSNPAFACALNVMGMPPDGSGGILSFNASTCYPAPASGGVGTVNINISAGVSFQ